MAVGSGDGAFALSFVTEAGGSGNLQAVAWPPRLAFFFKGASAVFLVGVCLAPRLACVFLRVASAVFLVGACLAPRLPLHAC